MEAGSSYFQTTIRIGNSDMQEETMRAVEMAFGFGRLGEDVVEGCDGVGTCCGGTPDVVAEVEVAVPSF